jgi:hypothetical protein
MENSTIEVPIDATRPKTEDRRPKTEDRRPKTEDRRPKTEDRRPKTALVFWIPDTPLRYLYSSRIQIFSKCPLLG